MSQKNPHLPSCIPVPISEDVLKELVEKAKDWAIMHGAAMRSKACFSEDSLNFAPFVLLPSTFPSKEFRRAVEVQIILNELVHRVAHNREFLTTTLKETIQVDEFTGNLFKIYETVQDEGVTQRVALGLLRSDYMIHSEYANHIKQVEINTIASSFGGIATSLPRFHRYVLQELGCFEHIQNLPENNALAGLCQGMLEAWKIYGDPKAVILFIVEDVTYNICDQRLHEFKIRELNPHVKVIRRTLTQVGDNGSLNSNNELIIDGLVVSVIYFRAGYEPGHYPSKKEWDARLLMERSQAIKSPSIQYHLAGTKKVQQALAKSGILELFLTEAKKIESVRDIFTGLYGLDFDEFGDQAVQMALNEPDRFVLKPQREGGGNNFYGSEVREVMLQMKDSRERTAWILMERILPPLSTGYIVRPAGSNPPPLCEMVSELGIFGVIIGDSEKILVNKQVGHMLRTKVSTANEGGVAAGLGALDSPYLID
ncbi:glutathione synthetase isoform X2 [Anoplophora glabripennis]|uniref:glutathione synthetase isoform X2 n=1 Tax=Anoplophora glabripennis TaxID=217634 RepID=UPI0008747467|nr:glutathione synthetase isoform X2 [Anoplophora glabripennis]